MLDNIALSSSCTLTRTESELEWHEPAVVELRNALHRPVAAAYDSARRWIKDQQLEAVVCFNGRIDMTAAIAMACEHANIPYVTHERSWFGDGLYLNPNTNCLSLRSMSAMVAEFEDKPLTGAQAALAGKLVAERFLRRNAFDWRIYNRDAISASWPLANDGPRVLVLPSSKNEFAGQPEWYSDWEENTQAVDEFMQAMSISPANMVVRCHPNWAENIGVVPGSRSLRHYKAWCAARGIHCISSEEKHNTYDLIEQADIVILNGSSAALEAGACGKQIYCLGPSFYKGAGFLHDIESKKSLEDENLSVPIDPEVVIRKTLRFIYLNARRFPQFNDHVRAIETTRYKYFEGADAGRLINIFKTGVIEPDDGSFAQDDADETLVVKALVARDWQALASHQPEQHDSLTPLEMGRRRGLRWVDRVRSKMVKGDLK